MQIESYYIPFSRTLLSKFFYEVEKALHNLAPAYLSSLMSFDLLFCSHTLLSSNIGLSSVFKRTVYSLAFVSAWNLENYLLCLHLFPPTYNSTFRDQK